MTEDCVSKVYTLVAILDSMEEAESFRKERPYRYIIAKMSERNILKKKVGAHPLIIPKFFYSKTTNRIFCNYF